MPWIMASFIQLIGMEVCVLLLDVCVCHLWNMYGVAVYVSSDLPTSKTKKNESGQPQQNEKMSVKAIFILII